MNKRPTPHLIRKRNKRGRHVIGRMPGIVHVPLSELAKQNRTWGNGHHFPEGGVMALVNSTPPLDMAAVMERAKGKSNEQAMQELIDALPPEREEFTLVGTPAFFKSIGVDPNNY